MGTDEFMRLPRVRQRHTLSNEARGVYAASQLTHRRADDSVLLCKRCCYTTSRYYWVAILHDSHLLDFRSAQAQQIRIGPVYGIARRP